MKKRRKLITVQDKIKEVLHKQKKAKDSAIGATNCEIRELFPYMAPIFYEDFVEMLTEEQTKELVNALFPHHRKHLFEQLSNSSLFHKIIFPESRDTELFEFVSDERLKELFDDYASEVDLSLLFTHLFSNGKLRMMNLLDENACKRMLKYFLKENLIKYFFDFIVELRLSEDQEMIYKKLAVLPPELIARLIELDTVGTFSESIFAILPDTDKIAMINCIQTNLLNLVISQNNYALIQNVDINMVLEHIVSNFVRNSKVRELEELFENFKLRMIEPNCINMETIISIYSECPKHREYILENIFLSYSNEQFREVYFSLILAERLEILNFLISDEKYKNLLDALVIKFEDCDKEISDIEKLIFESMKK